MLFKDWSPANAIAESALPALMKALSCMVSSTRDSLVKVSFPPKRLNAHGSMLFNDCSPVIVIADPSLPALLKAY